MNRLNLQKVEELRRQSGKSLLLFITDRCPVGCRHCSVDSRAESSTIKDFQLFERIVEDLSNSSLEMIGVSGGEPFIEKKGLSLAVTRFSQANKKIVLYTSGVWAQKAVIPSWIEQVVSSASCIFLSTDGFHHENIDQTTFSKAAQYIRQTNTWLIVQVLDIPDMIAKATELLLAAFGKDYESFAELSVVPPLPYGRAKNLFERTGMQSGSSFGKCLSVKAPVVRYDGTVSGCCNEKVIMGYGPSSLRKTLPPGNDLNSVLEQFSLEPTLELLGSIGGGTLTELPMFSQLAEQEYSSICGLCWDIQEISSRTRRHHEVLQVIANYFKHQPIGSGRA